jgi:hypothetical protein
MPFVLWDPSPRSLKIPVKAAKAMGEATLRAAEGARWIAGGIVGEGAKRKIMELQGIKHYQDECLRLLHDPTYPRTFLTLGLDEITTLSKPYDTPLLCSNTKQCAGRIEFPE